MLVWTYHSPRSSRIYRGRREPGAASTWRRTRQPSTAVPGPGPTAAGSCARFLVDWPPALVLKKTTSSLLISKYVQGVKWIFAYVNKGKKVIWYLVGRGGLISWCCPPRRRCLSGRCTRRSPPSWCPRSPGTSPRSGCPLWKERKERFLNASLQSLRGLNDKRNTFLKNPRSLQKSRSTKRRKSKRTMAAAEKSSTGNKSRSNQLNLELKARGSSRWPPAEDLLIPWSRLAFYL